MPRPPLPESVTGHAHARVGLLGNPADQFGARGLGFTFDAFGATVTLTAAAALDLGADDPATCEMTPLLVAGWEEFRDHALTYGEPGLAGSRLLVSDGGDEPLRLRDGASGDGGRGASGGGGGRGQGGEHAGPGFAVPAFAARGQCDVPRQSGLSGSSAILVAFLRALADWCGLQLPPHRIAQLAWRAEVLRLGIRAGPMDRLVQAHEGLVAMDWSAPWSPWNTRRVDPSLLPSLLVAWQRQPGEASGSVHSDVFARWQAGDATVLDVVARFAPLADAGLTTLLDGDAHAFAELVDGNLALRQQLYTLGDGDQAMVDIARSHGAGAKLCGSGGAVLCALPESNTCDALRDELQARGFGVVAPLVPGLPVPRVRLRVVLLAAGFATRLYPLTRDTAKPLLEVGGLPMLTRMLHLLAATGAVQDVVVVHNHRFADDFARWRDGLDVAPPIGCDVPPVVHLVDNGISEDGDLRGAVADLQWALQSAPAFDGTPDGFVVTAGDNLLDLSLDPLVHAFAERRRPQLLLRRLPEPVPPGRYSEVTLDADGRVQRFREKPDDPQSPLAALAVYALPADLPALIDTYLARQQAEHDAPGHLLAWLCTQGPVDGVPVGGRWFDIGNTEQLARARAWCEDAG